MVQSSKRGVDGKKKEMEGNIDEGVNEKKKEGKNKECLESAEIIQPIF